MNHISPALQAENRLPVVDAIRALAVVSVVLFHVFPHQVAGGFIGVDIFFAISGFVIALRYFDELVSGETRFSAFFLRRIRRLVPAYFVLLLVVTFVSIFIMVPKDLLNFGQSLAAQSIYLQNVAFITQGNYFDDPLLKPLLHTWSLAVEEQFYLAFPLLILLFRWNRWIGHAALLLVTAISVALGIYMADISAVSAFFLLPTRVWEFTLGILAAFLYRRAANSSLSAPVATALSLAGVAAMALAIVAFDENAIFPSMQAVLAVFGACVVMVTQSHVAPLLRQASANPAIQHFGRISYSWYLWHWPIVSFHMLWFGRHMSWAEQMAALIGGYVCGVLSYKYIETWGQRAPALKPMPRTLSLLACFTLFALVAGAALMATRGLLDSRPPRERELYAAQMDRPPRRCSLVQRLSMRDKDFCRINEVSAGKGILLLGDSHADAMKPALAQMASRAGRPLYLVKQDCRIIDYGKDHNCPAKAWQRLVRQAGKAGVSDVIVISRYRQSFDSAAFTRNVADLTRAGLRVTIQTTSPESAEFDPATYMARGRDHNWPLVARYTFQQYERDNSTMLATMHRVAAADPRVTLIEPYHLLCPSACLVSQNGRLLYHDQHHLTSIGARLVAPLYQKVIG